jgi:hypothetical protein
MKRTLKAGILAMSFMCIFLIGNVFAEENAITKDGKVVILKDNNTWEYAGNPVSEGKYAEEAVEVWDKSLIYQPQNTEANRYSNSVGLFLHYKNNTDKKVIGVSVSISVVNPFGKSVYEATEDVETVLQPNEKKKSTTYWEFKENTFMNNLPYNSLWQMAKNGTAKIKTKILKVVFEDGTILTQKPEPKADNKKK